MVKKFQDYSNSSAEGVIAWGWWDDEDVITGTNFSGSPAGDFDDLLSGGRGADSIDGLDGNDIIIDAIGKSVTGAQIIDITLPDEIYDFSPRGRLDRAESIESVGMRYLDGSTTNAPTFHAIEEGGNDTFNGGDGNDNIMGDSGHDLLDGGNDNDHVWGGRGDDTVRGGDGRDDLFGNSGDDRLEGEVGDDILLGGSGNDTLDGGWDEDILNGGTGADLLHGGSGADVLDGGDLPANYYDGLIAAGLLTRAAADAMIAQANAGDTATFNVLRAVDVDLERAVQIGGDAEGDTLTGIENLRGTLRADTLRGDDKANVLEGGAGSDLLEGRGGADTLIGGNGGLGSDPGIDTASYASSDAAVNVDLIRATQTGGDAQGDTLSGIERLLGSRFGDQLRGDDLNNVLDGGFGNDTIDGRGGVDTLELSGWDLSGFGSRSVTVTLSDLGDGTATRSDFFRLAETDTIRGIENVLGSNVRDAITGNGADNRLEGRAGNDVLSGGGGADTIVGGTGNDDMTGGSGADVFDFNAFEEMSIASGVGFDIIRDFRSGVDKIDLRDLGDLTAVSSFQGIAGQVQFVNGVLNGVDTAALAIDRNGDNVSDHILFVATQGNPFPLTSDLLII